MDWQATHKRVMDEFLRYVNQKTDNLVLKGGTALFKCYALNRFSEDIDLDGDGENFFALCDNFAANYSYKTRQAKDTDTVKRVILHYGEEKTLKIELSSRRKNIPENEIAKVNGITVYTIDSLAIQKAGAYQQRDKIRDLYDVAFIINHYYDDLSPVTKQVLQNALSYKGLEQFDYIVRNQADDLVDKNVLAESFLRAYDKAGLLSTAEERNDISPVYKKNNRAAGSREDDFGER